MLLLISLSFTGKAQNRKLEISLKGSLNFMEYELKEPGIVSGFNYFVSPEITYYIKPGFGVGLNFSIPLYINSPFYNAPYGRYESGDAKIFNTGISAHFSTNRQKLIRLHGTVGLSYMKETYTLTGYESIYDPDSDEYIYTPLPEINASPSGLAYSASVGLGVRITRSIVFNLLDVKGGLLSKNYGNSSGSGHFIGFESGFIFMFLKEK